MTIQLPEDVKKIIEIIEKAGYEAYAVGGCVRDSLLLRNPNDWDITTSAKPEKVKELFKKTIDTGIEHGTVTVMMHHVGYEVTTYRIDGEYEDARHPKNVTFTSKKPVDSEVRYTDLEGDKHILPTEWNNEGGTYKATARISVKGGSTVDFKNVPDGVSYSVEEEAPGNGYEAPKYDKNKNGSLKADKDTSKADVITTVTNTKKSEVDTGVLLNNAPYIAILGGAAVVTIYVVNKRRHSDMD